MAKAAQPRKEATTLRLEPVLKYVAELASKVQRRSLTSYIEWSLEQSFKDVQLSDGSPIIDQIESLWDIDEADRFIKLAYRYPDLLSFEEQRILKTINENFEFFKKNNEDFVALTTEEEVFYKNNISHIDLLDFKKVRDHWDNLKSYAQGEIDLDFLSK